MTVTCKASRCLKGLAETQLTQDNADQYLNEVEDKEEVREVTVVLCGTPLYRFVAPLSFTEWSLLQSESGSHKQENVSVHIPYPLFTYIGSPVVLVGRFI